MVVFGLILLLIALAVIAYMWLATRGMEPVQITYGVLNVDLTPIWLFVIGGITLAAATCGIWLLAVGTRSKARKAREVRELRRNAKDSGHTTGAGTGTTARGSSAGAGATSGGRDTRTDSRSTPRSDAPILPRSGGSAGTGATGTAGVRGTPGTDNQSSLDLDR